MVLTTTVSPAPMLIYVQVETSNAFLSCHWPCPRSYEAGQSPHKFECEMSQVVNIGDQTAKGRDCNQTSNKKLNPIIFFRM